VSIKFKQNEWLIFLQLSNDETEIGNEDDNKK